MYVYRYFIVAHTRIIILLYYYYTFECVYLCERASACVRARARGRESARAYGTDWNVVLRRTQRPGPRSVRMCTGGILDRGHRSQDSARDGVSDEIRAREKSKRRKKNNNKIRLPRSCVECTYVYMYPF